MAWYIVKLLQLLDFDQAFHGQPTRGRSDTFFTAPSLISLQPLLPLTLSWNIQLLFLQLPYATRQLCRSQALNSGSQKNAFPLFNKFRIFPPWFPSFAFDWRNWKYFVLAGQHKLIFYLTLSLSDCEMIWTNQPFVRRKNKKKENVDVIFFFFVKKIKSLHDFGLFRSQIIIFWRESSHLRKSSWDN